MRNRLPLSLIATLVGLTLIGCQQLKEAGEFVGEQAQVAGTYIGEKFDQATTAAGSWLAGQPDDDQTACYATERVAFYDSVSDVKTAESVVFGARLLGLIGAGVAVYSDSIVTRIVAVGFSVTMVALAEDIEANRARTERVTSTFNDLMACRREEARALKSDVTAGRTSRSYGRELMATLRTLVADDVVVARGVNETLQQRTTEFELSTEKAKEELDDAPTPEDRKEREEEIKKAQAAVQTNQQAVSQQSASIEMASALEQSDAFELSWWIEMFEGRIAMILFGETGDDVS